MAWLGEAELMRRLREHRSPKTGFGPQRVVNLFGIGAVEEGGEVQKYLVVARTPEHTPTQLPPPAHRHSLTPAFIPRRSRPACHSHPNPMQMERLEGSLRELLDSYNSKGRQPPLEQALTWLLQTSAGLAECHEANVVHSDIKAANTLVDKKRDAKIGDLGAGRVTRGISATASLSGTSSGSARGSVLWLASELVDEPSLQPSKQSDVYAWGIMAHEILSCRLPYHRADGSLAVDVTSLKNMTAMLVPRTNSAAANRQPPPPPCP